MADFFSTLFGGGAQQDAANANAAALSQYGGQAQNYLTTGYNTGVGNLNNAIGAYTPLANLGTQYNQAGSLLTGALGAGGPQGTAAAQAAFQNAPGYTGAVTAGTDAILRQMGAAGMSNSGNTAEDVGTFTQNLQNQQYNTWLQNLGSVAGMGLNATGTAAAGQAAGDTGLANLAQTYAGNQAGVSGNIASGTMADNNMVAQGQAQGAQNLLGAGLSLATLGLGGNPLGGKTALPSFGSSPLGSALGSIGGGIQNMNLGQSWFGGGTPTGIG
jgi:hypothetical protein